MMSGDMFLLFLKQNERSPLEFKQGIHVNILNAIYINGIV
jgi:hypothetical protein